MFLVGFRPSNSLFMFFCIVHIYNRGTHVVKIIWLKIWGKSVLQNGTNVSSIFHCWKICTPRHPFCTCVVLLQPHKKTKQNKNTINHVKTCIYDKIPRDTSHSPFRLVFIPGSFWKYNWKQFYQLKTTSVLKFLWYKFHALIDLDLN